MKALLVAQMFFRDFLQYVYMILFTKHFQEHLDDTRKEYAIATKSQRNGIHTYKVRGRKHQKTMQTHLNKIGYLCQ